jgi:TonB family protein
MVAAADRLFVPGPRPRELWLTVGLSVLLHGLLTAGIILVPRFQVGTYIQVPVSYTVSLVSAPPAERAPAPAGAVAPAPTPRAAPAPRPAPLPVPGSAPAEELTLPGRRPSRKAEPQAELSLRPPSVTGRETPRPAPSAPVPVAPAAPAVPGPSPAPVTIPGPAQKSAQGPPPVSRGAGAAKASGVEVASIGAVLGAGEAVLASYLTLVDWKIQQNWVPVGAAAAPETVVVVRFRVLRSGQVRDIELEAGSGIASLDNSALRAVRQSLPLPPFPNLLTEASLALRYRFVVER